MESYSRTADAESVVLNFAKVLTYSSVLLYTLEREEREEERRTEHGWGGVEVRRSAGVRVNGAMSVQKDGWQARLGLAR
jgi:hypothetical protein